MESHKILELKPESKRVEDKNKEQGLNCVINMVDLNPISLHNRFKKHPLYAAYKKPS